MVKHSSGSPVIRNTVSGSSLTGLWEKGSSKAWLRNWGLDFSLLGSHSWPNIEGRTSKTCFSFSVGSWAGFHATSCYPACFIQAYVYLFRVSQSTPYWAIFASATVGLATHLLLVNFLVREFCASTFLRAFSQ